MKNQATTGLFAGFVVLAASLGLSACRAPTQREQESLAEVNARRWVLVMRPRQDARVLCTCPCDRVLTCPCRCSVGLETEKVSLTCPYEPGLNCNE